MSEIIRRIAGGNAIRAYHGSPHDFDMFDSKHIGSGEGNAAQGHGLYFAGREKTAQYYRDFLSPPRDKVAGGFGPPKGKMYEVGIDYPERSLLDFRSRIDQQGGNVQDAMRSLLGSQSANMSGRRAYREISTGWGDSLSDAKASQLLFDHGIPGLRFPDSGSQKHHNYVVFPGAEQNIRILRKYGLLAPVAAGAAAGGSDE
jgi:hypothetical protein